MTCAAPLLVLNAGSSSLKFAVFDGLHRRLHGQVEGIGTRPRLELAGTVGPLTFDLPHSSNHVSAVERILDALRERGSPIETLAACGHRVVHGGSLGAAPLIVDDAVRDTLDALRALAPLHNGVALDAIDAVRASAPGLPQIACFDTAFHATVPTIASRYALPATLHADGYRRFGFHGLSFEHVAAVVAERAGGMPSRLLIFHLGNGASLCAVRDGRSVATTMGYSTLDGLVMGTRCGAIDPGIVLALQRERGMTAEEVENLLYRQSGLLALSGRSSDMRELLRIDDEACRDAVEHFCYWAARHAGSLAVALGGVDAIAFTGGIGAGSAPVRARILAHLEWLGLVLDPDRNQHQGDSLQTEGSRGAIWRVEANEELSIARHLQASAAKWLKTI